MTLALENDLEIFGKLIKKIEIKKGQRLYDICKYNYEINQVIYMIEYNV